MRQHIKAPDPWAAVSGAILAITGVFELEKKLGISASDLAIVIGSLITIGATLRHWLRLRKAPQAPQLPSVIKTLTADSEEGSD